MEFKTTLEIVTKDIQDIEKLVGNFKNYSKIPNIELDLALSRLRNVYDLLLMFREDGNIKPAKTVVPVIESIPVKKPVISPEVKAAEPLPFRPEVKDTTSREPDGPVISDISAATTPEKSFTEKKTSEDKKFVNEKLGEHTVKKDLASKIQGQAIKSIAGSLGINDKFFFIRELFAGDSEVFRQTMAELDELRNFNEAYSLLLERFQWDMDSEPVQMLLNLIRRKYITSGNE